MGEDSSHAERSSNSSSNPASPLLQQSENMELLIPSFSPSSSPSSPTNTLARLGFKSPTSPTSAGVPGSPADRGQVSAITVVALLDKLVNMLETVQENQRRMELQQANLEGAVRSVQGDVTRLSKSHTTTSNSVNKLLERSRKVSGNMKEVKERMDKQAALVKRLEANHIHLLRRNHFKVLIFQEDTEIPSSVFVKDSLKSPSQLDVGAPQPAPSVTGSVDATRCPEEGLQTISLSSDEDDDAARHREEDEILVGEASLGLGAAPSTERSRADKLKRSSLKKVDSLKKAFSRQSIEKKMNKISTKIVPPERREKIMKSLTPNHPKSPTAKSSSFKVSPITFNVKKVRDGEVPMQDGAGSLGEVAHVEIPPLGSLDGEHCTEVHCQEGQVEEGEEMQSPSTPGSIKVELEVSREAGSLECNLNADRPAGLAVPEHVEDDGEDEEDEEEEEHHESPVEVAAAAQIPTATITMEQVS